MTPTQLLDDYTKNKRYGSIEFVYKDGNIVFVKKVETLLTTASYEKNSTAAPRERENGVNHRDTTQNY
jgi:hypothetical protein